MTGDKVEGFLQPNVNQIRKSIRDIDDSYNHDWDILAELCQNSVDAIREVDREGEIQISIDCAEKRIRVKDNGIGISPESLPTLLKPFASKKDDNASTVGEKGVGLTFVIFQGNYFKIKTGTDQGSSEGEIIDAKNWKNRSDQESLDLSHKEVEQNYQGTEIIIEKIGEHPIFDLSFDQLKHVLRTKTAIGNSKNIWNGDIDIEVNLSYTSKQGEQKTEEIPFKYKLAHEEISSEGIISLEEFEEYASKPEVTDSKKRKKLKDKIIINRGSFSQSDQREISYIALFVPDNNAWRDLNINDDLTTDEKWQDENWRDNYEYALFHPGIYSSVKGMPTGIETNHPSTGYAGYWSRIFILFEDPGLSFDIGRKSLHGAQSRLLQKYSKKVFNRFMEYVPKYVAGSVSTQSQWDKDQVFGEIEEKLDLETDKVNFGKTPRDQEASVSGLFFECIGNGLIENIKPLSAGYKHKYDLYAKWENRDVVIEFKSQLKNILDDFTSATKMFDQIDCVVCWDVSEEDKESLKNQEGLDVEEIQNTVLNNQEEKFPNATHEMNLSGITEPVYVIDLKRILEMD